MSKGVPVMLPAGDMFLGRVVVAEIMHEFTSSLISRQIESLPVWIIATPYNLKKIQQREFVRLNASLPVQIVEIINQEIAEDVVITAVTKDFSGGGMQLVLTQSWSIGTKLLVTIHYPDIGSINQKSEVVRVQQPQSDRKIYWVGIKFLEMNERDRSSITKLIFKTQLELRRKGLE